MKAKNSDAPKHLILLSMVCSSILILSVFFDYKFIKVGPLLSSAATFIISTTFFINDVIAEVYGYERARNVIWYSLVCLMLFAFLGFMLSLLHTPASYNKYGAAYLTLFALFARSSVVNTLAILLGAFFNIYFVSKWKVALNGRFFWARSLGSTILGEAIYTIFVVSFVNLGIVPFHKLLQILLISYSFKFLFNMLAVIPTSLFCALLKKAEGFDVLDRGINYNPFKFYVNKKLTMGKDFLSDEVEA